MNGRDEAVESALAKARECARFKFEVGGWKGNDDDEE